MPRAALKNVTINYLRMGAWDAGRPPLVLVHGLAASSAFWFHVAETMSHEGPVLIHDLRGHGRSTLREAGYRPEDHAADLLELLDVLEIPEAIPVGHSFGGSVVLHALRAAPERFRRAVLADTRLRAFQPTLTPAAWPRWEEQRALLRAAGLPLADDEPEAGVSLLTVIARLTLLAESEAALPHWMMEFFGQRQTRHTAARWVELVEKTTLLEDIRAGDTLTAAVLSSLPQPLLAVYGGHSPLLPSGEALAGLRGDVVLRIIPEAGHFFPAVRPREFLEPLRGFLG